MGSLEDNLTSLSVALDAAHGFLGAVEGSFGPAGGNVGLVSAGNEVCVTVNGGETVAAMRPLHPTAQYISGAIAAYADEWGDGVKSFVIMLAAGLRDANLRLQADGISKAHLSGCINRLATEWIPTALEAIRIKDMEVPTDPCELLDLEKCVIHSVLCGRNPSLKAVLLEWLQGWLHKVECNAENRSKHRRDTVLHLLRNWTAFVHPEAGAPITHSCVNSGAFLKLNHLGIAATCSLGPLCTTATEHRVAFVHLDANDAVVAVESKQHSRCAAAIQFYAIHHNVSVVILDAASAPPVLLQTAREFGVNLVVPTQAQAAAVFCTSAGIQLTQDRSADAVLPLVISVARVGAGVYLCHNSDSATSVFIRSDTHTVMRASALGDAMIGGMHPVKACTQGSTGCGCDMVE
eukprot:TRINITY_DN4797_c0_g1_i10.p1 TRINITY_DN4797_c0_g1~~TRINITY_DN4797_c0_g1_i10.p1  ORF type:complete len:406 (-),score=49.61 TRINITY_DN4797_c0_g1_i10:598-1815(-)